MLLSLKKTHFRLKFNIGFLERGKWRRSGDKLTKLFMNKYRNVLLVDWKIRIYFFDLIKGIALKKVVVGGGHLFIPPLQKKRRITFPKKILLSQNLVNLTPEKKLVLPKKVMRSKS